MCCYLLENSGQSALAVYNMQSHCKRLADHYKQIIPMLAVNFCKLHYDSSSMHIVESNCRLTDEVYYALSRLL